MDDKHTVVGTDVEEVKRQNADSGLTYNEAMEVLAKTGGKGTAKFSDTNREEVKRQNKTPLQ